MAKLSVVGKSVIRIDALEKVTGKALFCTDIKIPRMLHAKVLRSPFPHARILNIDTSKAEALPGVACVATGMDVPQKRYGTTVRDEHILARDVVRFAGEPVAAVAAEAIETAERLADAAATADTDTATTAGQETLVHRRLHRLYTLAGRHDDVREVLALSISERLK